MTRGLASAVCVAILSRGYRTALAPGYLIYCALVLLSQKVAFWEFGILDNFGRFVFRHEELRWITQ